MIKRKILGVIFIFGILTVSRLYAWVNWKALKTPHFTVFYKAGYEKEADRILQVLERYRNDVVKLTGGDPGNVAVTIEDWGQLAAGFADPFFKKITLLPYPPDFGQSSNVQNWYRTAGIHEYTHITHLTQTRGIPRILKFIFGSPFQLNMYSPGWIAEGITVFSESQSSAYEGRLNDGFFDAYIGTRTAEDKFPSLLNATYEPFGFPFGRIYLYGGEFFNYLAQRYGRDKFSKFFKSYGSSPFLFICPLFPFLGIDRAAMRSFGKSFPALFKEWQEHKEESHKNWEMDGKRETKTGWYINFLIIHQGKLYYVWRHYKKTDTISSFGFVEIMERDLTTGKEQKLLSSTTNINGLRVKDGKLYYTASELEKGYANVSRSGFGVISLLHERDLVTRKDKVLFSDRIRAFTPLSGGGILYSKDRNHDFGSEIWIYKNGEKKKILELDYLVGEMVASSEYILFCAREDWENWNIYLFDFKDRNLKPLIESPYSECSIFLCRGKLLFRANYGKMYNAYAYDLYENKVYKLTHRGYADFPALSEDGLFYFVGLHSEGFDIYSQEADFSQEYEIPEDSDSPVEERELEMETGSYLDVLKPLLKPALHVPFAFPDTPGWRVGGAFLGQDAVGENLYFFYFDYHTITKGVSPYFMLNSRFFSPLNLQFNYQAKGSYGVSLGYPLLQRLHPGLSSLYFSTRGRTFDQSTRKEITNNLSAQFHFPGILWGIRIGYSGERKFWNSEIDRDAYRIGIGMKKALRIGEVSLRLKRVYDPDRPDFLKLKARGYRKPLSSKAFFESNLEYSFIVFNIRKGLWNPNLFLEDFALTFFGDALFSGERNRQLSIGIELKFELGTVFLPRLCVPKVGVGLTEQGRANIYSEIELGGIF